MGKFKTAKKMINMSNRRTPFPSILLPILVFALLLSACGQPSSPNTAPSVTIAPSAVPATGTTVPPTDLVDTFTGTSIAGVATFLPVTRTLPQDTGTQKAAVGGLGGATLLAMHCSACHSSNLAGMTCTANQWKELIDQMISQGAQLTPQEKQVLIVYLAATYHP
jgi:mono/diheme cytochrome c family protein